MFQSLLNAPNGIPKCAQQPNSPTAQQQDFELTPEKLCHAITFFHLVASDSAFSDDEILRISSLISDLIKGLNACTISNRDISIVETHLFMLKFEIRNMTKKQWVNALLDKVPTLWAGVGHSKKASKLLAEKVICLASHNQSTPQPECLNSIGAKTSECQKCFYSNNLFGS